MAVKRIGVYWFTNDLRLSDNPLLKRAADEVDQLLLLYCQPKFGHYLQRFSLQGRYGEVRQRFNQQCIAGLAESLQHFGQTLVVVKQAPQLALSQLIVESAITDIYCDDFCAVNEQNIIHQIRLRHPQVEIHQLSVRTLFSLDQLPFTLDNLPRSFSRFRQQVESLPLPKACLPLDRLPPMVKHNLDTQALLTLEVSTRDQFVGGEYFAMAHCQCYFASSFPRHYKQTRNSLDGFEQSTKFSPWLALGCISPKQIVEHLEHYEQRHGRNDSTYWIYFELLWREYFQWYAVAHGSRLFQFAGLRNHRPLTTFYSQRFKQWCCGNTEYPLVNACMKQLNQTGYMSNRGRQLAASCLLYELGNDWRYGAAYFESQLIDYDVASNWGNWQYIAGVGASEQQRHFNLDKQAQLYDRNNEFVLKWLTSSSG